MEECIWDTWDMFPAPHIERDWQQLISVPTPKSKMSSLMKLHDLPEESRCSGGRYWCHRVKPCWLCHCREEETCLCASCIYTLKKKPDNCYPPHTHIENCLISYCCLTIYPKMLRPKISTILLYRMITDSVIQTGFS